MRTVNSIAELRQQVADWRQAGLSIGFAPTMGNLHAGHISLVERALERCDKVISSVFVNPLQFGPDEDLEAYPRTLEEDERKLSGAGCHLLFAPPVQEMYPRGQDAVSTVAVPNLTKHHCGASRPGHFDGVTTVVAKLFNLVQPDQAFFGKKDFQQLRVIRQMVEDLCIPVEIVGVAICREPDGLAMSSRNQYLSAQQRADAPALRSSLLQAAEALEAGQSIEDVAVKARATQVAAGFKPDYFNVCDADNLLPQQGTMPVGAQWVILAASYQGKARLLDNIELNAAN